MKFAKALWILAIISMTACVPVKRKPNCDVHTSSRVGGTLDIDRTEVSYEINSGRESHRSSPVSTLHVFWQPPSDGFTVHLVVGYKNASLESFGPAHGARIQFTPGKDTLPEEFQAVVDVDGKQIAILAADADFGPEQGDFLFPQHGASGQALLDAINSGQTVHVTILKLGKIMNAVTFKTSGIAARDKLLANARKLIEANDVSVCMRN